MYLIKRAREVYQDGGISGLFHSTTHFTRAMADVYKLYYRMLVNGRKYDALANPIKLIWVPATRIDYKVRAGVGLDRLGSIKGGNWDQQKGSFEDSFKFKAVKGRYIHEKSWEETGIYDHMMERIEEVGSFDGCTSMDEVEERYQQIDDLYHSMKEDGFDLDHYISDPNWYNPVHVQAMDHPKVCIGRDGELLFSGGYHRVSIARILDIEIPVRVTRRHEQWQLIREEINEASSVEELNQRSKCHLTHPDMQDIVPDQWLSHIDQTKSATW